MPVKLTIEAVHAATQPDALNEEWIVVKNSGDTAFNGTGCSLTTGKDAIRQRVVTTLQAGLVIQPGERVRLVSGSSGKKTHGVAPEEEGIRNYHLFLKGAYLDKSDLVVRMMNRQVELCRSST